MCTCACSGCSVDHKYHPQMSTGRAAVLSSSTLETRVPLKGSTTILAFSLSWHGTSVPLSCLLSM